MTFVLVFSQVNGLYLSKIGMKQMRNLQHLIEYSACSISLAIMLAMGWNEFALHYGTMTFVLGSFEINDLCLDSKIAFKSM